MGKIILNNIEYGIGITNGSNIDTTNLVEKDSIVTTLDDTCTDDDIPSAKAVHTAIQNVSAGVPADVYSKTEVDDLLADKADSTDIIDSYTKEEVDNLLNDKVNTDDVVDAYSKTEVDNLLANKADSDTIVESYSKDEVDDLLADKADTSAIIDAYTKDETNGLLDAKVNVADLVDAYSKTEVDGLLTDKVNTSSVVTSLSSSSTDEEIPSAKTVFDAIQSVSAGVPADVYSKTDVDGLLADKADIDDLVDAYSKTEVNDLLDDKANTDDIIDAYTKTEVDGLLTAKVDTANIIIALSSSSTDTQIPSAKTVFDAIQNVSAGIPADVYSKTEVDGLLANKADTSAIIDAYSKTEVDGLMNAKANANDVYAKTDVDNLLSAKADSADIIDAYTKDEIDDLLADKADSSSIVDAYSKEEVNNLLDDKVNTDDLVDAYSKEEVNNLLNTKADSSAIVDAYTKTEVDTLLTGKADSSSIIDAYNKTEVDNLLADKADSTDIVDAYTKGEVDGLLADKANVDDLVDSYSKTETDGLLATKADSSALNNYVTNSSLTSTLSNYADILGVNQSFDNYKTYVDNNFATKTSVATNTTNIATNTARIDNIPNPNILINGAFKINDYEVNLIESYSSGTVNYVTNRWATTSGGLSFNVASVLLDEDVPFDSNKTLNIQASLDCTGLSVFQIIEDADALYDGKTLTLSFWIKGLLGGIGKTVTARIGSGGGNTGETRVTLTDSWQYVTSTRTGSYFGSKSDGGVLISSYDISDFGAGFKIACVKLEEGDKATPFVNRTYPEELELCQRYYQRWNGISHTDVPLGNFSVGTGDICSILHLPTTMRTTPSIKSTLTDVELYGCNTARTAYEAYEPTHLSVYSMSNNTLTLRCRSNGTFAVGSAGIFRIKFGQQYKFILDAELYS